MAKRKTTTAVEVLMSTELATADAGTDAGLLDSLIAELNASDAGSGENSEIIEAADAADTTPVVDDSIIESAMEAAAEAIDREELYAEQGAALEQTETSEADKPKVEAKPKRERKAKAEKPDAEPKVPRVTFHGNSRSAVLDHRLKGKAHEFLILEAQDALLSEEELKAKQDELRDQLDNVLAKKVAEKAIMLFRDLGAGVAVKNEVMAITFQVLKRDGYIQSGDKGNLQQALGKKYSVGTSRSQSNQMFAMLPFLKITNKAGEKGKQEPNPNSALLPLIYNGLGL